MKKRLDRSRILLVNMSGRMDLFRPGPTHIKLSVILGLIVKSKEGYSNIQKGFNVTVKYLNSIKRK